MAMAQAQRAAASTLYARPTAPLTMRLARAPALSGVRRPSSSSTPLPRRLTIRSAYVSPASQAPPNLQQRLNLDLPTADFQTVLLTALRRRKGGTAILVQEVAPGSAAYEAGLRPGQQILAISDPIRQNEVWELNGLASLKYVRQAVEGRANTTITVRVTGEPLPEWQQAVAAARAAVAASSGSSSEGEEELSGDEKAQLQVQLERLQEAAQQRKDASRQEKLDQRKAYELDNLEKKRSSTPFFVAFVALFLVVPAGIVVAALSSGYLDSLGPR